MKKRIEDVCIRVGCESRTFFERAFEFVFGKRPGVKREAGAAHARFKKRGSLTSRARKAVAAWIAKLHGSLEPVAT